MPSTKSVLTAAALAFFASVNSHMILLTPPPYGSPNSSPLDASGSDFPCKGTSSAGGTVTNMAVGSKQQLSFKGSAVHGGGSCQVSLTTDNPATKNSKWMVIHSIEGGCPARGQAGNEGDAPNQVDPDKYDYTIPQGISPGKYTLAWTWFNKIGNREMYMNCASVQIAGGSSKRDTALNETEYGIPELSERDTPNFPAMFVANVPTSDCETTDSMDLQFPDPGTSVEKAGSGTLAPPKGAKCGAAGSQAAASGSSSGSTPSAPSAAAAAPAAAPVAGGSSSSGSSGAPDSAANASGGSAASPSTAGNSSAASPSAVAGSSGSSSASAAPAPAAPATPAAAPATGASTGTCNQPGQSICSPDGKQIGTCTQTNTVTWIPVAAGTKCSGGIMVMASKKRSARFPSNYKFGQ